MTDMTAEEKKAKDIEDAMKKHDANEDFRKKMDSFMDSMSKRMDAWEAMDSKKAKRCLGRDRGKGRPQGIDRRWSTASANHRAGPFRLARRFRNACRVGGNPVTR